MLPGRAVPPQLQLLGPTHEGFIAEAIHVHECHDRDTLEMAKSRRPKQSPDLVWAFLRPPHEVLYQHPLLLDDHISPSYVQILKQ